jgi:ubiquinone/menaquinone biosynthesis C-methylase UbiE
MWAHIWCREIGPGGVSFAGQPLRAVQRRLAARRTAPPIICTQQQTTRGLQVTREPGLESRRESQRVFPSAGGSSASPWKVASSGVNMLQYATGTAIRSAFFLLFRLGMLHLVASGRRWSSEIDSQTVVAFSLGWRAQLEFVRFFLEQLTSLSTKEWKHIRAGTYVMPRLPARHPSEVLPRILDFMRNLGESINLRASGITDAIPETFRRDPFYPSYYKQNFHYQTDGYLSAASAERYDFHVEVLFGGLADMMRRQALVPLLTFLREQSRRQYRQTTRASSLTVLNVPCGPGGFLLDLLDNLKADERLRDVRVTNLDLSPFYLQRAQARSQKLMRSGDTERATFVHANAESLPFPNESFDAIVSIYLFHELPDEARRRVLAEWTRVLRPGGRIVFADSLQMGDNPAMETAMNRFRVNYHEPYYQSFIETNLRELFSQASNGQLVWREDDVSFLTKISVFEKRAAPS